MNGVRFDKLAQWIGGGDAIAGPAKENISFTRGNSFSFFRMELRLGITVIASRCGIAPAFVFGVAQLKRFRRGGQ
jgi:hypothetical protein